MKGIASLLCLLFLAPCVFADDDLPYADSFGSLPAESSAVLSPDGHYVAWLERKEGGTHIIMFDVPGRKVQRSVAVGAGVKLQYISWDDNETLLTVVDQTLRSTGADHASRDIHYTVAQDVAGGADRMLPSISARPNPHIGIPESRLAWLVRNRLSTPKTVVMGTVDVCRCLWRIDTRTGDGTVIAIGNGLTAGWVVNRDGRAVAREDWDWHHHSYHVLALGETDADKVHEILRKDDSEQPRLVGLMPDGKAVMLLATSGLKHQGAWAVPLDGSAPKLIAEDPDADISNVFEDPYSGAIVGVYVSGNVTRIKWLDPAAQHRQDVLDRSFPGKHVNVYGWTADGTKTLARVQSPTSPPVYYLVDFTTHRADIVAEEYPRLAGVTLGEVREISYKARDGTDIPAYLTLPPAKPSGPVPMVVLPHSGPNSRDLFEFDWMTQFLASRGYAVLQPQFRGSIGFGDAFLQAGYKQWGGLMQDDVTDGVRAMIEQGVADPHRVCIVGAQYGGYAALAGATFTPELYRCAASIAGISDLKALLFAEVPHYDVVASTSLSQWKEHIGGPHDANLVAKSPINAVQAVKAPILLIYGAGDGIPSDQSLKMAEALKQAGKEVKVVELRSGDHWPARTGSRVQVLNELDIFLKEHL